MADENNTNIPQNKPVSLQDEMRSSYLDYAMSVIIGRAIPDARDGLKPVHRRILYAMHELRLTASQPYKKCAKVVGEVLGKYHPHGDASVYDALVRMAQDFSMRHMLIDGQGNFGSVDGDPPAAYRYTECRLSRIAAELLTDIEKDTVDVSPNFDDSEQEPVVLPARVPNLLVNGAGGIAVGMATNIPPHNLAEVVTATIELIRNPERSNDDLIKIIPGPDFPTGGIIYGRTGIEQAYRTGRGTIVVRARAVIEKMAGKSDREQIVVIELPYQVNKARLHSKIAELVKDKRIEGISEVRDESDRDGMRLVIELRKDVFPQVVLNQLYRLTDMQTSFGVINLSIVEGRPEVLDLRSTIRVFIDHRREVVTRRCRFELQHAQAEREIVEGLGMAITEVDLVIKTIRAASDPEVARAELMKLPLVGLEEFVRRAGRPEAEIAEASQRKQYFLSERQAKAILDMRLARLTGLEREKLAKDYGQLCDQISHLAAILADVKLLMDVVIGELEEIRTKYQDKRRTEIVATEAEINMEDLVQEEDMVVTISHAGYIKRTPSSTYRAQRRGGKGKVGMEAREEDFVNQLFVASTHAYVFFFSDKGKVYVKKVYEIPSAPRNAKGRAIVNFVGMEPGEKIAAITPVVEMKDQTFIVTLTRRGQIKKTEVTEYENVREKGIIGVKIEEGDQLLGAALTDGTREIIIATQQGMSIRFDEKQVRAMGRATQGVKAIDLSEGDHVVGLGVTSDGDPMVLAVCEKGYGKRTPLSEFRPQNRGGRGIILIDASERNGPVVGIALVKADDEVMLVTDRGQTLRTKVSEIRETGRVAQGVRVMTVEEGERVVAIEALAESEEPASLPASDDGSSIPPSETPPSDEVN
ncbi:MAG TPA: DNA gyrase subunit A [Polyangiaceae bacterium]